MNPSISRNIKFERIKHYFKLFEQFGQVEKKKDLILTKSHCFIIYKTKESCDKVYN